MEKNQAEETASFAKITSLNCFDLSSPDINTSVSLVKQSCLDCGFFYVINHGISQELMDEVFAQSRKFFELPMTEKMKVLKNEKHRGYTPLFDEVLDPENQVHGDYKEGYYVGREVPEHDPDAEQPFFGPNVWPASGLLPEWRQTMEKYDSQALEVGRAVARIIALALDLDANFFDKPEILGKPISLLRLLHYEARASDPSKGIFGAGAHTDFGLITLLATDDVVSLQICKDKDARPQRWEYVPPMKGAFVVNLGDMLERWSNGIFKYCVWTSDLDVGSVKYCFCTAVPGCHMPVCACRSTLHRVIGNGQERYSIAYFVEPGHDCVIECLQTCQSETNPPKYSPVRYGAYLTQRYKDTHAELSTYKNP